MAKLAKSLEHISVLLAQTNCGYYILKEILEKVKEEERKSITKKLLRNADSLVFDQNGHTVLKKIVEYMDTKWSKTYLKEFLRLNFSALTANMFGSRVVQKYISCWADAKDEVLKLVLENLVSLSLSQYGSSLVTAVFRIGDAETKMKMAKTINRESTKALLINSSQGKFVFEKINRWIALD